MKLVEGPYTIHKQSDMVPPHNPPTFWRYEDEKGSEAGVGSIAERKSNGRTTHFEIFGRSGQARIKLVNKYPNHAAAVAALSRYLK